MEVRQISRYRVLEQIGSGGMSVVYKGVDTSLEREVAIKVLHPHLAAKPDARRRFSLEAKAVARLHHPNILEIFDFSGDEAPESFIVTEYIRGSTLREFAEKHRFHPPEIAAIALHELAAALEHAHAIGVVHRDLKPENVMIREDGVLKLMDFGIAKFLEREERMTMTGALVGSPAHMAPEIIEGLEAGREADVFSLGTILYWLCCGKLPFQGNNTTQTLKLILEARYPEPRLESPAVSDGLAAIIARCMAREPVDRYASAAELRAALSELLLEAGIERPGEELAAFFTDPDGYRARFTRGLVERLLADAERSCSKAGRNVPRALECLNRVLALDPQNGRAAELLAGMKRRRKRNRRLVLAASLAGATLLFGLAVLGGIRFVQSRRTAVPVAPVAALPSASRVADPAAASAVMPAVRPAAGAEAVTVEPVPAEIAAVPARPAEPVQPAEPAKKDPAAPSAAEATTPAATERPGPRVALAGPAARPSRESTAPTAGEGRLEVMTRVRNAGPAWGKIFLDGKWVNGQLPTYSGMVPAGSHKVRVEAPCCIAAEREVVVDAGALGLMVVMEVDPKPAQLAVESAEPCEIWIEGVFRGNCADSVKDPVTVAVPGGALRGNVKLSLTRAGKTPLSRVESFEAGKLRRLHVEFEN